MRLADLLPLFPLDLVLFPEIPLPLHIFEPRYREMIAECLREKREFGVIRALAQEHDNEKQRLADCGCTAEIVDVLRTYPDGRMDILTAGRKRFEVIAVDDSRSFVRGEVQWVEDVPATTKNRNLQKTALEQHYQLMRMTGTDTPSLDEKSEALSFHLAHALPVDIDFKQALLEMRSEDERLSTLLEYYSKVIPKLKVMAIRQKKAGTNGWVH